jgi:predicted nucleotidyltransferase
MYLFGSLTNGDFDAHSDIDVLFVTDEVISEEKFQALYAMHENIAKIDSPWAIQLEVSYIPRGALRRYDPPDNKHPHMDRGADEHLHIMQHDSDWIVQRYILRERGIRVDGPALHLLIDPIPPGDLRWAVSDILHSWICHFLDEPQTLKYRGYQSYTVLTLCRILYTYETGEVVSKPVAAEWAKRKLDKEWIELIDDAIQGRQAPGQEAASQSLNGTLDFIRYALEKMKPTPYPDVNEVLNLLHSNAKGILGDQFVGMYLYGSLSSGDFNPKTSDIDFLVVTKITLPETTVAMLDSMHRQTWATSLKRAGKLEGAYVPQELIRQHDPNGAPCPQINEGRFYLAPLGSDWIIQRHVVREHGVSIEGPDPKALIDFVTSDDIHDAVMGTLHEWWFPMLDDPSWLRDKENGDRAFAVITMCRVLHALEHGTIVSKPKAIRWAKTKLDAQWNELIDKAVSVSNHEETEISLDETLSFIQFTMETIKQWPHIVNTTMRRGIA